MASTQNPKIKSAGLGDLLCAALLLSFALAIAYPRWRAGIDWRDEGLLAYGAVRVMHGEVPQRDFVSVQPPLSFYTAAGIFKLFGTSLASLRGFGLAIFLVLPLLIYGVGRNFMGAVSSFAAAAPACVLGLPYCNFVPLAVWQGIAVSLAALLFFLPAIFLSRQWLAVPAGVLSAVSLFLRHDQAVYTIISIVALTIVLGLAQGNSISRTNLKRALVFWLVGIAVIFVPAVLVWWKIGALPEIFRQLIVFPFATYRKTSSLPFPRLMVWRPIVETAVAVMFYLPPFVQVIAALYLVQSVISRRFRRREAVLCFLVVWSALFYLQVLIRSDFTHLVITLPPFFLLTAFGWSIVHEKIADYCNVNIALSATFAGLAALLLWLVHSFALPDVTRAEEELKLDRGGVRIEHARALTDFVQRLQADVPPERSMLALPYQPMFYFLCERRNPTRWNYLWPGDQSAQDHERLVEDAERDPPAMVLLAQEREVAGFAPTIIEYLRVHYLWSGKVGDIGIYVRF
ncbi:MAG: hypothetical protein DME33_13695 [Verrucomicrobia bacterium]|nr:MAG: hypothetical protein DME33_13695 [Verrucomicrobiota bacterium]